MNQSNKEYLNLLIYSGVKYFYKETPNNLFDNGNLVISHNNLSEIKNIENLIKIVESYDSPLKKNANKTVVCDGNKKAKLMIIGEAPGKDEDQIGKPFVGQAGQLLNKMLTAINIKREDVYITNVIPWRPTNNRTPTEDEILEFLPFLQRQIEIIQPKIIYLLGATAAKAILSTTLSISKLRKKWETYKSINLNNSVAVLVSYHPAFLLRSPDYKKKAWEDLQILQKKLNDEN